MTAAIKPRTAERERWSAALLLLALAATLVACWPALAGAFVYDDLLVIQSNPRLADLAHWWRGFGATYWEFLEPDVAERIGYWRPLATLAHTLTYAFVGLAPYGYHVVSLALHLGAVALAFGLTRRLTKSALAAFCAAVLFGLHPLNVESWAWISAQNGLLAGFFALASLCLWLRWRDRGSSGLPLASAACFALAVLSKEIAVVTPLLAACLDLTRRRGPGAALRPFARGYAALAAVLLGYFLARVAVFGELGAGLDRAVNDFGPDVTPVRLLRLRIELLGGGLRRLVVPETTLFRVFRPTLPVTDRGYLLDLAALVAWLAASALAWFRGRRATAALLLLAPVAILPLCLRVGALGVFPVSDRFYYVASAGFAVALAATAFRLLPGWAAASALTLAAGYFGVRSHARSEVWSSEDALFRTALAESADSPYVHWGLGRVLLGQYRATGDLELLAEAHAVFERSGDLLERALEGDGTLFATRNDLLQTNLGLGWCYLFEAEHDPLHDFVTPRTIFETVVQMAPDSCEARTGLGVALAAEGETAAADRAFRAALELNERYAPAHHNLALLLTRTGDWARAQKQVEAALKYRVDHREDLLLLARIYYERGFGKRAREVAEHCNELYPRDVETLVLLATLAGAGGDGSGALARLDQALALDPDNGPALAEKARELARQGQINAAMEAFRAACERLPGDFDVHYNMGALLLQSGAVEAAVPFLQRAYGLTNDVQKLALLRQTLPSIGDEALDPLAFGRIDERRGHDESSLAWMNLAVQRRPKDVTARLYRSRVLQRLGKAEEALADVVAAEELAPATFLSSYRRAELLDALGRGAEACVVWKLVAVLDPPGDYPPEVADGMREHIASRLAACE